MVTHHIGDKESEHECSEHVKMREKFSHFLSGLSKQFKFLALSYTLVYVPLWTQNWRAKNGGGVEHDY